jgi:hypothetical protein
MITPESPTGKESDMRFAICALVACLLVAGTASEARADFPSPRDLALTGVIICFGFFVLPILVGLLIASFFNTKPPRTDPPPTPEPKAEKPSDHT